MPYVARLKNNPELLLLAEPGLLDGPNVVFRADGRTAGFGHHLFNAESEREIDLDSQELTDAQRQAYNRHSLALERAEQQRKTAETLRTYAARHPFRPREECFGGEYLPEGQYAWEDTVGRLEDWLRHAPDEDVIGHIGNYGRRVWLKTALPRPGAGVMKVGVNTDTRAEGVASFLIFVDRCGGPAQVRAQRTDGPPILLSADGALNFSASHFYLTDLG